MTDSPRHHAAAIAACRPNTRERLGAVAAVPEWFRSMVATYLRLRKARRRHAWHEFQRMRRERAA